MAYLDRLIASTGLTAASMPAAGSAEVLSALETSLEAPAPIAVDPPGQVAAGLPEADRPAGPAYASPEHGFTALPVAPADNPWPVPVEPARVAAFDAAPAPPVVQDAVRTPAPSGLDFLEATAAQVEEPDLAGLEPARRRNGSMAPAESSSPEAARADAVPRVPSEAALTTYAIVREWVSAPPAPRPANDRQQEQSTDSTFEAVPALPFVPLVDAGIPASAETPEQHVSLTIGAIEVVVEGEATPEPRREPPVRERVPQPSIIESRRAQRRSYSAGGGF